MGDIRVVLTESYAGASRGQVAQLDDKVAEPLLKGKKAFLETSKEGKALIDKMMRQESGIVSKED